MGRVAGKVALVTGAATGIGRGAAVALAAEGAKLIVTDVDENGLKETVDVIRKAGGTASGHKQDVTDEARWAEIASIGKSEFGGIHVLVNNAGIAIGASIFDMSYKDWQIQQAINVDGVFLGVKHVIPVIAESGGGSVINISSVAGYGQSTTQEPAYAASKGAVRIFSKVTATQHAKDKIRCNTIFPGPVDTEMIHAAMSDPKVLAERLSRVPLGRLGRIEEIIAAVMFLASDDSAYMTGGEMVIDGGATSM